MDQQTGKQNRLDNFERMLEAVLAQHRDITEKMERLKQADKTKTATYRQLMGNKLMCDNMLSMYRLYGLLE